MWWKDCGLRLRALFFRRRMDEELQEELQFHIDMQARKNQRNQSDREAKRQARLQFGSVVCADPLPRSRSKKEVYLQSRSRQGICASPSACCANLPDSRRSPSSLLRSASAPTPPSSRSSIPCCSAIFPSRTRNSSSFSQIPTSKVSKSASPMATGISLPIPNFSNWSRTIRRFPACSRLLTSPPASLSNSKPPIPPRTALPRISA